VRAAAQVRGIPIIELSFDLQAEAGTFTLSGEQQSGPICTGFAQEDDVALVLHTSGTTSRPKIVPLTQRNLCSSTVNHRVALALTDQDRCLNMMPLFHIHGLISVVLTSLLTGGSVVCTPGFDASKFFDWLEEFKPTWFTAAPALYQGLLAYASNNHKATAHHSLRFLRSAAAALPQRVLKELEQVFNVPVVESYGMTEAAAQITSNPLPPGERKARSVGVASGPEVAIMDDAGNLLDFGQTGEIAIRGTSLMEGYENDATANSSSFQNGWLRTGDQGFVDSDGYIFITGRIKEIINRGGEKISPREIDEALLDHPGVAEVATFAVSHARMGEDVVVAVVLRENASLDEKALRDFASARLSQEKLPSRILIVEQIPKGPTGKLQRGRLAEELEPKLKTAFSPARSKIESTVAEIWAEILGVEEVGIYDNFFTLGGDSLSATRVVARLHSALQLNVSPRILFDYPTVVEIAQWVIHQTADKGRQ
jgi:acyl-CoA synthetase (AMP-forming)/AMP-acid ligase II/acyl carrier protein